MKWIKIMSQITFREYIKLISSVYLIGTSIYDLLEDISKLRKEHGVLLIGLIILYKTINEIIEKVKAILSELKTDISQTDKPKV